MKLRNLFVVAMTAIMALISCEEVEHYAIPELKIREGAELIFGEEGGKSTVTFMATRDWKVTSDADWVAVDPDSGTASSDDCTIEVSVLPNDGIARDTELSLSIGMLSRVIKVSQAGKGGATVEDLIIYANDFDKEEATKTYGSGSSYPYLDQFDGWINHTGKGAADVTYNFTGMSARSNSTSDSNYSDYAGSGKNNMFFGANAYLAINKIALGSVKDFTLTFGTEKYDGNNKTALFDPAEYHVYLSNDGKKWVEIQYTFAGTVAGRWNVATANFSVPEGTENLWMAFKVDVASVYRMDDVKLMVSETEGAAVNFAEGVEIDFTAGGSAGGGSGDEPGGGESDGSAIYSNNFDKVAATKTYGSGSSWPYLDQFDGWQNEAGTGAANVTYSYKTASARNNSNSNGDYSDYAGSGMNNIFFGANSYFAVHGIALGGAQNLTLTFGTEKYLQDSDNIFQTSEYHIWLSNDGGAKWVELTDYTFAGTEGGRWNVATANFTVPSGTQTLSICMQVDVASAYRMDDMKLVSSSTAGTAVDFSNGVAKDFGSGSSGGETPEPPVPGGSNMTIAEVLALGSNAAASGSTIEAVVISNMDLNNLTSKKGLYVQDETGGLQFYLAANHEFKFGDKVKIDMSGVKLAEYNGAVQISGLALEKIEKLSSGNAVTPKTVKIADFLANKYEGQYIAIEGVQVVEADLAKTFVVGGAHTSINVEDANGNKFAIFSSKYASYGTTKVPQGSGTIKGISSISKGAMQIIFAQESDFAGLTGERLTAGGGETPGDGGDDPVTPPAETSVRRADFETLSRTSSYVASTSDAGWVLTNCAVQEGGEKDANPVYILLGKVAGTDTWAKAACMNGKTTAVGTIESPELTGGCGTLSFDYANIFTEANGVNFQIEVIQNGAAVKTIVVDEDSITKMTKYTFSQEVNVSGSFKLKFTNLSPSNSTSNKDRVSIWNLTWTEHN